MSAQSINKIDISSICNKIDDFMICEGNYFRNIIDYDVEGSVDYKKLRLIIWLKQMLDRTEKCEDVLLTINKILIK
jgi:ribosomal silencing factor RsfS